MSPPPATFPDFFINSTLESTTVSVLFSDADSSNVTNVTYYSTEFPDSLELLCNVEELNNNNSLFFPSFLTVLVKVFQDHTCHELSQKWTVFMCLVYLLIFLFGFVGNSLVILVISCKRRMKTVTNLFIFNLAVADLLVIVFCVPANLLSNLFTPWILGGFLCKAVSYIQGVSVYSSVYSLVAISMERCQAIRKPLRLSRRLSKSKALVYIAVIWVTGLILTLPWTVVFHVVHHPLSSDDSFQLPFCLENWGDKHYEKWYFIVANLFLCYSFPLTLITIFNVFIWKSVLQRQLPQQQNSSSNAYTHIAEMHRRTRLRVLKMVTCLTFAFFICWLPLYVVMTMVKFSSDPSALGDLLEILVPIAQLAGSFNSCVNPILYAFLNQKFRDVFTLPQIFRCHRVAPSERRAQEEDDPSLSMILKSNFGEILNPAVVNSMGTSQSQQYPMTVIKATAYSSATALTATPTMLREASK